MIEIGDLAALKRRIKRGKSLSFLVGAPFSWDQGQGVPPVTGFIDIIRERVAREGPEYSQALKTELASASEAQRYQSAMSFVYRNLDADAVEEIVRTAVTKARVPGSPALPHNASLDGEPEEWLISRAQRNLARLMKIDPVQFRGPVFTTNFDPLIGLALKQQKIHSNVVGVPLDGSIGAQISMSPEQVNVFHLHGYWRDSATLHRPQQLLADRPQLQTSLARLLEKTNLVVMAYSGWDDIFTEAIARCLASEAFKGVVTWCFYNDVPAVVREGNIELFEKFAAGISSGRIEFFCGVNCHTFFDEVLGEVSPSPVVTATKEDSPLPGWQLVSEAFLDGLSPLTDSQAIQYFDGGVPTWRHALSPLIPRRNHVATLSGRIAETNAVGPSATFQLIRAAGGEGKSTIMLQASADAVRKGDVQAVFRIARDAGLHPDQVEALDQRKQWLLIIDDAENIVDDLWSCIDRLHSLGRTNIFFLAAARDFDWRRAGGDRKGWASKVAHLDDIVLVGLTSDDAGRVVQAWERLGELGLRALGQVATTQERSKKLLLAVQTQDSRQGNGSFFGGLLATRFSPEGLIDHVVTLMESLRKQEVEGGIGTLYDALVFIANCHAVGMPGLDRRVLAELNELQEHRVTSSITTPLGRELGAAESREFVLTRHKSVAEAVVVAAETRFDGNLEDFWQRLVRVAVQLGKKNQVARECHGPIVHAGANLMQNLPKGISAERRGEIGILAAKVAMEVQPDRMDQIIDLARAMRKAGDAQAAIGLLKAHSGQLSSKFDYNAHVRGYYYEWGTCAGNVGGRLAQAQSAWLDCFSLSNGLPVDVTALQMKLSCAGLGIAFGELSRIDPDGVFALGRRAATYLGWLSNPDPRTAGYFKRYDRDLERSGTPKPSGVDEALEWLAAAAGQAHAELNDPFLKNLVKSGLLEFTRAKAAIR